MKKILAFINLLLLLCSCSAEPFVAENAVSGNSVSQTGIIAALKTGWNLGNTLDANQCSGLASETSWGMPYTTKEMIDGVAAAGFKTIRVPVSWANHIIDDKYTIDPAWLNRVKQIVDWSVGAGLYVIINIHHDNYTGASVPKCAGFYPHPAAHNESLLFVRSVWSQVASYFKSYDEHLIFEILNEPRLRGHSDEWWYRPECSECRAAAGELNKLNQYSLNAIRAAGGKNVNRYVMVSGLAASLGSYFNDNSFKLPEDKDDKGKEIKGKLMLSVHMYTPGAFAIDKNGSGKFTENTKKELIFEFNRLYDKFVSNGVPVVIGEYGATNKNNLEDRVQWFDFFVEQSSKRNMAAVLWDNGQADASTSYEEKFGYYNRTENKWFFPEINNAIMKNF